MAAVFPSGLRGGSVHSRLGEILLRRGAVGRGQLEEALEEQRRSGRRLGEVLVSKGYCSPEAVADAVAEQAGVPRAPEGFWENPPPAEFPAALAVKHRVFPLEVAGGRVRVATADPLDLAALDEVRYATGMEVSPEAATPAEVEKALRRWYGPGAGGGAEELLAAGWDDPAAGGGAEEDSAEGPAARAAVEVIRGALAEGASDVHVEPHRTATVVRYRVDGVLREAMRLPRALHQALVSRIKVMAGLDIANRLTPQDGRIRLREPREVDLRVSTLPTTLGEAAVLRVLDRTRAVPRLEALGYSGENLAKIRAAVSKPYGLVLVTGPTGSGKSTTLAAVVAYINETSERHVITLEDPVEYMHRHGRGIVNQREVGGDVESFAEGLRAALREDPDVILVGEMRDLETIATAITAAETGHLVLSTLHTNTAAETVERIIDVFPPHQQQQVRVQLAGVLQGVLSQQLLPRRDGRGRVCAVEVLVATHAVRALVREGKTHQIPSAIQTGASEGMVPMDRALADLVLMGLVGREDAEERAVDPKLFARYLGGGMLP